MRSLPRHRPIEAEGICSLPWQSRCAATADAKDLVWVLLVACFADGPFEKGQVVLTQRANSRWEFSNNIKATPTEFRTLLVQPSDEGVCMEHVMLASRPSSFMQT
jgi:hypothetical protein